MSKSTYLAENIKRYRKQKGMTQDVMASKLAIKRSNLGAYEEGRAEPDLLLAIKISKLLEVPLERLMVKHEIIFQEVNKIGDDDLNRKIVLVKHLIDDIETRISKINLA